MSRNKRKLSGCSALGRIRKRFRLELDKTDVPEAFSWVMRFKWFISIQRGHSFREATETFHVNNLI